jgi:uncharacterized membrane protein YebE (DUF533 family)
MTDLNKVLDGLMKSGVLGNLAGGVAGGALAGLLTGKGNKLARAGALAAVGGLAWKAWQSYQEQQTGQPNQPQRALPERDATTGRAPAAPAVQPSHELLMMRAMIAAAHADGHIDAKEQTRIFAEVDRLGLAADDKAMLFDELRRPLGLRELVELTPDATAGAEVYAASMLALDPEQPVSGRYLDELARLLALPAELVAAVRAEVAGTAGGDRVRN